MTTHTRADRLAVAFHSAADWLRFAAAPAFAAMAVLAGALGGGPDMLCAHDASPLSGMVAMYMLMSAFHSAPWLKRLAGWRSETSGNRATLVTPGAR